MNKKFLLILLSATAILIALLFIYSDQSLEGEGSVRVAKEGASDSGPDGGSSAVAGSTTDGEGVAVPAQSGAFSPEMGKLVKGIEAGQVVRVKVGDTEMRYVFRPKRITAEGFKISAGATSDYPSSFQVFAGRQLLVDGRLTQMAKLAVVNDTLSMAYTTEAGEFLIEENDSGELTSRLLLSYEEGSTFGHFQCAEGSDKAGVAMQSTTETAPPPEEVEISLAAESEDEPAKEGARADHPYYRLGAEYDASLKDILILMVSSKSQTGTNLSSKAASYFTYAAIASDVYERQLGLRYFLQELVLIPSNSTEDDIEPAVNDPNDNGDDDLAALNTWLQAHRPQSTYQWGHAMGWTLVDGVGGGMVGWAWLDSYGKTGSSSRFAQSVNEPAWTWGVHVHELGHNVGASHTSGGAMNPSVSKSSPKEDFFTQSENGSYTAATDIYNYMSSSSRNFVFGPADLRNPIEMPFGVDDAVSTAADTPVTFNPLTNDLQATPLFGQTNSLRLVEVGQVFPKAAGTATVSGNEIIFTPASGFTGNVWFSYTLSGDVGNGGNGWLHSADVVVTVGGDSTNPSQSPVISTTDDTYETAFSGDVRINPLLNDEGTGRLSAGTIEAHNFDAGSLAAVDGAFRLVGAQVIVGNGSVELETVDVTSSGLNAQGNTGYLVYTPGASEPSQVEIQYTVEDANGIQSTGTIFLNDADSDDDGLLDSWEISFFGNLNQGSGDDPDGDGADNLTEFQNGTDPTRAATVLAKLTGTVIGAPGSYNNDPSWDKDEAWDGDLNTYYDAANANGDWTGLDLGSPKKVGLIKYAPRSTWPTRMTGGQFQASNSSDFSSGVVTFYTIPDTPDVGILTERAVNDAGTYRYVRYLSPDGGYCNVAEVEFWEDGGPDAPSGLAATPVSGAVNLDWNNNTDADFASYNVYRGTSSGSYDLTPIATGLTQSQHSDSTVISGTTYYYVVSAVDSDGFESVNSPEASVTFVVNDFAPEVDAGSDQSATLVVGSGGGDPVAGAYWEWDAAADAPGDTIWESEVGTTYNWTFDGGTRSPAAVADVRFDQLSFAYDFPEAKDASNTSFRNNGHNEPAVFEFVIDVDGADGSIFESGGSGDGIQLDVVGGVLRGTVQESTPARVEYTLTPEDLGRFIHVVFLADSTNDVVQLYVDNDLKGSVAWTQSAWSGTDNASLGHVSGTTPTEGSTAQFDGKIALFRYYRNTVFDSADVNANFNALSTGTAATVSLEGTVSDADGDTPAITWSKVSGPGDVSFADSSAANTTATIRETGTYVLRLTADDGAFQTFDELTVTISESGEVVDDDSDGIDDSWETTYFGGPGSIDGSADSDGDGVADFFEYLYGSIPTDADSRGFRFEAGPDQTGTNTVFDWEVQDRFILGEDYEVWFSTNLSSWNPLPVEHYTLDETLNGGRTKVELVITHDYGEKLFLKLVQP